MADRPNMLLIMSDQHHPHVMGCERDEVVRTPNLDALASAGVLFESCYCPSPLCVPSRMSFMSARHPSRNEVWTNGCVLASDMPTFAHSLGAAGYEVVLSGRMHFVGPDQRHGFERRLVGQISSTWIGGRNRAITPELFPGAGQSRPAVEISGPGRTGYQAYDEAVTEETVRFLQERHKARRPLCLVVGYVLPHCPFVCPPDDWDYYLDRVKPPDIPAGYFESVHPAVQAIRAKRGLEGIPEETVLRARAGYYGLVTHLDRQVGEILAALGESELADNTAVIYTSDHGEMAGEHGLWCKSSFYEGCASVPLIVSQPGRIAPGTRPGRVCNLIDLGPTMIDLAGADPLPEVDGRSLAPTLRGETDEGSDETFSEHYAAAGLPTSRMVRRGPWKLTHYEGFRPQLFNLEDDPGEWRDLGDDPAHREVREELQQRAVEGWSASRIEERLAERARAHGLLAKWFRGVEPRDPEQWSAAPEDNVYELVEHP
jgi:choline-sulfatase